MKFSIGGLGLVLTFVFAMLKLLGVVAWSWLIVFTPLIIVVALFLIVLVIVVIAGATMALLTAIFGKE